MTLFSRAHDFGFIHKTLFSLLFISCTIILTWEIFAWFLFSRVTGLANLRENKVLANKKCFTVLYPLQRCCEGMIKWGQNIVNKANTVVSHSQALSGKNLRCLTTKKQDKLNIPSFNLFAGYACTPHRYLTPVPWSTTTRQHRKKNTSFWWKGDLSVHFAKAFNLDELNKFL